VEGLLNVLLLKDEFDEFSFPYSGVLVDLWVLSKNLLHHDVPILEEALAADFVRAHVIGAKALHAEVVDKAVFFDLFDVRANLG